MKKILLSFGVFASLSVSAQLDTLANHFTGTPTIYTSIAGGYIAGNNSYGDKAKMQLFDATYGVSGAGIIKSVLLSIPIKNNGGGSFKVKLWAKNPDGTLGAELGSTTITVASVDTSLLGYNVGSDFFYNVNATFNVPVPANNAFWAGVELPTGVNDTIVLNSTTNGDFTAAITHTFETWSDGSFHSFWRAN